MDKEGDSQGHLRKELFDYLRNLQRIEESRSKVNGTSGWILLVAIGYFGNWFANHLGEPGFQSLINVGLAVALLMFFLMLIVPSSSGHIELNKSRLIRISADLSTLAFNLLRLLLFFSPVVASYVLLGMTFPVAFGAFAAIAAVVFTVVVPIIKLFWKKPLIRFLDRGGEAGNAVGTLIALVCFFLHAKSLGVILMSMPSEGIIFVAHVAAFWLVAIIFVKIIASSATTTRHIKLEESLVFGLATPEEILRKLEAESLGSSLEEELESRERLIEVNQQKYDYELSNLKSIIHEVSNIPIAYENERQSRIDRGYEPVMKAFRDLIGAFDEKIEFINSILRAGKISLHKNVLQILEKDISRLKDQVIKLKSSTKESLANTKRVLNLEILVDHEDL